MDAGDLTVPAGGTRMAVLGLFLLVLGVLASIVGGIMMLIAAFRVSAVWGVCVLFVPFAALVFLFKHWQEAKRSFVISLAGTAMILLAILPLAAGGASAVSEQAALQAASLQTAGAGIVRSEQESSPVPPSAPPAESPADPGAATDPQATTEVGLPEVAVGVPEPPPIPEGSGRVHLSASDPGGLRLGGLERSVGQQLVFVERDGSTMRATLVSVHEDSIRIERNVPSGAVQYTLARAELSEIHSPD
jgi:hypothetical protein